MSKYYTGLPPFRPEDIIRIQNGLMLQRRRNAQRPRRRPMRIPLVLARRRKARPEGRP